MATIPCRELPSHHQNLRDLLEANVQQRQLKHVPAGSIISLPQSGVLIVIRGTVKLVSISINGDELLLGLVGPNEPFGQLLTMVKPYEAIAAKNTDLLLITTDEIRHSPQLAMTLVDAIVLRHRQAESMLALLGLRRVDERIRGVLQLMAQCYGHPCSAGTRLSVRLTHQDIANAMSTTRVPVTRVIGQLRKDRWITLDSDRHFVITHHSSPKTQAITS